MKKKWLTLAVMLVAWAGGVHVVSADQAAEEAAIRKSVNDYVKAFNAGDAKSLAAMWSPDAVYSNPVSGEQVVGRDAIEKQFRTIFTENKGTKLVASTTSVQFVSPGVAVETGTAQLMRSEQSPEETQYTAVYVKRDGQWLLDRITEENVPVVTSNYERLKGLEWMVGAWVDRDEQATVETTCKWAKNRNFLVRMFAVTVRDRIEVSGMQIIGWDPASKQIHSWVFDSDGGFGEGTWSNKDKSWYIASTGTTPDGSQSSATNIISKLDDNSFTWQSVNRMAGGELLPNVDEVIVVRQDVTE